MDWDPSLLSCRFLYHHDDLGYKDALCKVYGCQLVMIACLSQWLCTSTVAFFFLTSLSTSSQELHFTPAVRLQLITNNPEAWGGSLELGYQDSVVRHWLTIRVSALSGSQDYSANGFDISDKFRAVGFGAGLTTSLSPTKSLDYGGYLNYLWGSRAVVVDPLNWAGSYRGKGFDSSLGLRLRMRLGEVIDLCLGFEVGYRWILTLDQQGTQIADRPIGNGPYVACSVGLLFRAL